MFQQVPARWKALWNHDMYHGWSKHNNYFEGWYVKIVSADESHAFAFIPGISKESKTEGHAFIQVNDGVNASSQYIRFDTQEFKPNEKKFDTVLGTNRFNIDGFKLNLEGITGEIAFKNTHPWPTRMMAPGIMGWYSFVPFMQCYHGVVSLHHQLEGSLTIDGKDVDFSGGIGYIEKDWGTSFPKTWIWMQTNHLTNTAGANCFMASVAHIPWLGQYFIGFLCGLMLDGELHIFTTYNGSKYTALIEGQEIFLVFKHKNKVLEVVAHKKAGAELISPMKGSMQGKLEESIQSELDIRLSIDSKLVYEGKGSSTGLEIAGPLELITESKAPLQKK